ncbi:MAG: hypothetical protein HY753_09065 [Nitrospirae bacterium]|nr:hypothetical protein [Nitrospirota bacterium]
MKNNLEYVIGLNTEDEKFCKTTDFPGHFIDVAFVNAVFYSMEYERVYNVCKKISSFCNTLIIGDELYNADGSNSVMFEGVDYKGGKYASLGHPFIKILTELGFSQHKIYQAVEPKFANTGFIVATKDNYITASCSR